MHFCFSPSCWCRTVAQAFHTLLPSRDGGRDELGEKKKKGREGPISAWEPDGSQSGNREPLNQENR